MLANCESLYLLTRSRIDIIMSFSVHSSESLAVHKFLCSASYVFFFSTSTWYVWLALENYIPSRKKHNLDVRN